MVGLYLLNPPEHAVVISVDEKPSIQALERAWATSTSSFSVASGASPLTFIVIVMVL